MRNGGRRLATNRLDVALSAFDPESCRACEGPDPDTLRRPLEKTGPQHSPQLTEWGACVGVNKRNMPRAGVLSGVARQGISVRGPRFVAIIKQGRDEVSILGPARFERSTQGFTADLASAVP